MNKRKSKIRIDPNGTFSCTSPVVSTGQSKTITDLLMTTKGNPGIAYITMDVPGTGYIQVTATYNAEASTPDTTGFIHPLNARLPESFGPACMPYSIRERRLRA
jgi:hypothetical protein